MNSVSIAIRFSITLFSTMKSCLIALCNGRFWSVGVIVKTVGRHLVPVITSLSYRVSTFHPVHDIAYHIFD